MELIAVCGHSALYKLILPNFRNDDILLKSLLKHEPVDLDELALGADEFVYGICRDRSPFYNPYDLKIVRKAAIPEGCIFYTITHDNIMMVR